MHHLPDDRPRPDDRDLDDEIVEAGRLEPRQRRHLRARFHLEQPDRVGLLQHLVHDRVIGRQVRHVDRRRRTAFDVASLGARRLSRLASAASAMASHATLGNPSHFDALIHEAKAHPGQMQVAQWIREDLQGLPTQKAQRLQDRYSIRCAPQVIGVLEDGLSFGRLVLERELNGVSDNPIVAVERDAILHGGNFYGGHVAFVCDALKTAVANVACLLDRQIMLICNPAENGGLPANLVGVEGPQACTHNGFKAVTIAASSLAAEALKLTLPASAFSRSTELHNQDKVPMATLAARDLLRVVEISEQVAAMALLVCAQAYDLRGGALSGPSAALQERVRENVPKLDADRRMDHDIAALLQALRADRLLDPSTYAAAGTGR